MKWDGNSFRNLAGWVLLAAPILLLAERPADRTLTAPNAASPSALAASGNEAGESRGKRAHAGNSEDNWQDVVAFMKAKSPKKWAAYDKLPEASQAQLRSQLIARYSELSKLANNEKLHKIELDRVQIEDDLFGALSERKRTHAQGPFSSEYLDAVRKLIENRMEERKARLENLKAVVGSLETQVTRDESVRTNPAELKKHVIDRARTIERFGLGAAQGTRRRAPGQPATAESEDEVIPANP